MKARTLLLTGAAAAAAAVTGGLATDPQSAYYKGLRQPSWQPPPPAYGIVWTPLYVDIAVTSAQAIDTLDQQNRQAEKTSLIKALGVNLVLNASWNWLFFHLHRPWVAAAECAVLTVSSADLVRRVGRTDRRAGWALLPYPLWCGFATTLTVAIARLNPRKG